MGKHCDDPFEQIQEHEPLRHCFVLILPYHSLMPLRRLDCLNCLCCSVTRLYTGNLQRQANTESQWVLSWREYNSQIPQVGIPDLQSNRTQYLLSVALSSWHTCWEVHLKLVPSGPPEYQLQMRFIAKP